MNILVSTNSSVSVCLWHLNEDLQQSLLSGRPFEFAPASVSYKTWYMVGYHGYRPNSLLTSDQKILAKQRFLQTIWKHMD